jgi:hypothetical protein
VLARGKSGRAGEVSNDNGNQQTVGADSRAEELDICDLWPAMARQTARRPGSADARCAIPARRSPSGWLASAVSSANRRGKPVNTTADYGRITIRHEHVPLTNSYRVAASCATPESF